MCVPDEGQRLAKGHFEKEAHADGHHDPGWVADTRFTVKVATLKENRVDKKSIGWTAERRLTPFSLFLVLF